MQARNFAAGAAVVEVVELLGAAVVVVVLDVLLPQAANAIAAIPRIAAVLNNFLIEQPFVFTYS